MKEERVPAALLRRFLLGNVDDEERQRIEGLFLTDSLSRDKVLAAEQDLIEDYLDDSLTTAEKERFLLHYADTPRQRRKLRIAKTIQDWATTETTVTPPTPATISIWSRLRAGMRLKPVFVIPIAVIAMIAIVVTTVWVNRKREQSSIDQELARLNASSSLREIPPQMVPFELAPVSVRSVESHNELITRSDVRVVELHLLWIQKERYPTYQAVVRRFNDDESFTIRDLQPENNGGHKIRLRLPAQKLTRGLYQILLSGVAADGTVSASEEYTLTVGP
jgi:hypothetical protein